MRTVRGLLGLALMVLVAHCGGGDAPSAVGASGGGEDAGGGGDGAVGPTTGDDAATNNSDGGAGTDAAGNRDASDASDAALDGGGDADAGPPPIVTGSAYAHDQGGRLIGEYDEDGRPLEELIYLEDRVVATVRSGKAFAVQTDQLGAPRTVLADNAPVWSWDPEPFGATPPNEDVDGDGKKFVFDQRFPGQRFDAVTGLHQNFHRNYAPEWARYLEADPIGLAGGMNLYGYVVGEPLRYADPRGLSETSGVSSSLGVVRIMGDLGLPGEPGGLHTRVEIDTGEGSLTIENTGSGIVKSTERSGNYQELWRMEIRTPQDLARILKLYHRTKERPGYSLVSDDCRAFSFRFGRSVERATGREGTRNEKAIENFNMDAITRLASDGVPGWALVGGFLRNLHTGVPRAWGAPCPSCER